MKKVENNNKINPKTADGTSAEKGKNSKSCIYLNKTHAMRG